MSHPNLYAFSFAYMFAAFALFGGTKLNGEPSYIIVPLMLATIGPMFIALLDMTFFYFRKLIGKGSQS
jgi:hypothetical protein